MTRFLKAEARLVLSIVEQRIKFDFKKKKRKLPLSEIGSFRYDLLHTIVASVFLLLLW